MKYLAIVFTTSTTALSANKLRDMLMSGASSLDKVFNAVPVQLKGGGIKYIDHSCYFVTQQKRLYLTDISGEIMVVKHTLNILKILSGTCKFQKHVYQLIENANTN